MSSAQTILVTDDDPDLRDILRSVLEPNGFQVLEASDGQAALELIHERPPQLIILDYNMPRMDGRQVCTALKQDVLLRHIPIIMLTGRGEVNQKVEGMDAGVDDYLVKPFEPQELLARVRMVLRRTSQELEANPLTRLPGNVSIQREIDMRLTTQRPLAVCYADLDRFKAFNDHYGFARGDDAIRHTAKVLLEAVRACGNPDDFVGHIGGDDFVVITTPDRAEALCQWIVKEFDAAVPNLYDEADRRRGAITHTDRKGAPVTVGLLTISIALVSGASQTLTHVGQIAKIGAELKAYAKQSDKSLYVKERRQTP
jgi:diguanylate cyclase (GGDEF)-like protein